jgi:tripartite-type tricarboxylate transporter receptor subunit TctC
VEPAHPGNIQDGPAFAGRFFRAFRKVEFGSKGESTMNAARGWAARASMCAAVLSVLPWTIAGSQEPYPSRPIRLVVPVPPGGAADIAARALAQDWSNRLGQLVIVDNRVGAAGVIGSEIVMRASPDGYTLLYALVSTHSVVPAVLAKPPYDPVKDFTAVIRVLDCPQTLIASNSAPFSTVAELIAHARQHPGRLNFASTGTGSVQHLAGELLKQAAGIDVVHVPYKGDGPAMNDLIAGVVHIYFSPSARPAVESRKAKLLGVASLQRWPTTPDWPTIAESGLPGFWVLGWAGIMAPAATPRPIIQRLNATGNEAISHPETRKRFTALSCEPAGGPPEALETTIRNDLGRFKALGIRLDG